MTRTRTACLVASVAGAALVAVLSAGGPAVAVPPDPSFGGHVSTCAQVMGFDVTHNPSHHRGPAGWTAGEHC